MKRNNAQNTSAKKKLIPAVAMFTASAVMLSTATYAWFTMNKEVQVTGLNMTATAGRSLEISLGEITGNTHTNNAPAYNSESWQKLIAVSDYYDSIGKLKPASSNTGNIIYTIPDADVYGGGTKVKSTTTITAATKAESAEMVLKTGAASETADIEATEHSGYYIDVPMWIRSSNKDDAGSDVYCTVTIVDGENEDTTDNGTELMKAVRVAVIPVASGNDATDLTGSSKMSSATTNALTANTPAVGNTTVFGLTNDTYNTKVLTSATTYNNATGAAGTIVEANGDNDKITTATNTAVFKLPAANDNNYGVESFIVRVWLEGESKYCNDLTANQDWNINFDFSLDKKTATTDQG